MSIVKTEAVVLKSSKYREKSKIVTFFTKTHGKLTCIAKGVRDTKTKWGGSLQTLAYLSILFYYKENKQLHLLSHAEYIKVFRDIYENNEKTEIAFRIIDLVNKTSAENHPNNELFELLIKVLNILNTATNNYINVLFYFECKLAVLLGFGIDSEQVRKQLNQKNNLFESYLTKDFTRQKSQGTVSRLPFETLNTLLEFIKLEEKDIFKPELDKRQCLNLDVFFTNYFKTHIEDLKLI